MIGMVVSRTQMMPPVHLETISCCVECVSEKHWKHNGVRPKLSYGCYHRLDSFLALDVAKQVQVRAKVKYESVLAKIEE